jgi:hypothetical protein
MEKYENLSEVIHEKSQASFTPSKELLDFADDISNKFIGLNPTTYYSANKNYRIEIIMKAPLENETPLFKIGRVGRTSGTMELEKHYFLSENNYYSKNFMFYLILWLACERNILNQIESELLTFQYYEKTGRPVQDILDGYKWLTSSSMNPTLANRYALVQRLANSDKKEKND